MCAKLPCAPKNFLNGSDRAEYTRKVNLQKTKVNAKKITKVRADGNILRAEKEWRP